MTDASLGSKTLTEGGQPAPSTAFSAHGLPPIPTSSTSRASLHPDLKTQRIFPGPLYFLSFATTFDLCVYALGLAAALCMALPFAAIDLTYGHWTSGLVPRVGEATPDSIRSVSTFVALISIGTTLGMLLFAATFWFCLSLASSRVTARMRYAYLAAILSQPATYFETVGGGEVASRMSRDIALVSTGVGEKLGFAAWSVGSIFTGIIVSFYSAPRIGGVLFSILPFSLICFGLAGWFGSAAAARISKAEGNAATFLEQVLSSCRTVKVLKAQDSLVAVYDTFLEAIEKDGTFLALSEGVTYGVAYFGIFSAYALAFYYGGQRVAYHDQDTGKLITSFFSIFSALYAATNLLPHLITLSEAIRAMGRIRVEIDRLSSIDPRSQEGLTSFPGIGKKAASRIGREIEVRNVTFEFPSRPGKKALDDVSLTIERGKVTALVGHSGSGKSTVTALLLRQYDLPDPSSPTSNIFIDGVPIASLRTAFLRQQISIVSQDPMLSTGTVLDNVAVGLTGTPFERDIDGSNDDVVRGLCQDALEKAQAWDFVSRLPDGIDSVVSGARTGVLSGGQRQRIAVARALVRKASILVIDEGTSALDSSSESLLMARIAEEQRELGMTVILIAHRLSTVRDADRIIVMGRGRVMEEGMHATLEAAHGEYFKMLQLSHGIIPDEAEQSPRPSVDDVSHLTSATASLSDFAADAEPVKTIAAAPVPPQSHEAEEAKVGMPVEPKKEFRSRFTRYVSYPLRRTRWLVPGMLGSLAVGAAFPLSGWLLGQVLNAFSLPEPDDVSSRTKFYGLMFTVIAIGCAVFSLVEAWFLVNGSQRVTREIRREGAHAVLRQDIAWFEGPEQGAGALTAAIGRHGSDASVPLGMVGGQTLTALANFLGTVALGFSLSWALILVGFAPLVVLVPVAYFELHFGAAYEKEAGKPVDRAASYGAEAVDSIKTVAAFGQELRVLRTLTKLSEPDHKRRNQLASAAALFFGLSQAIVPAAMAVFFAWGGSRYADGSDSLSTVYAVFEAAIIGAFSLSRLFSFSGDFSRAIHAFKSFAEWVDRKPAFASLAPSRGPLVPAAAGKATAAIDLEDLTFAYPSRPNKLALSGVSLSIRPGEKIALCGPSGGGKSSILACIARFYEPQTGTIKVDQVDIRSVPLDDHWGSIALVAQDASLYAGTVRFNLTLGLQYAATDAELRHACEEARIWDFVQTLDHGIDTELGLKGLNLSGGQRQRLCIARALLRRARILLLDEATSALDNESEALVQEALDRVAVGRTTVVVAHRLSTIRNADRIVVVDEGRIVEIGSHEELLRKGGRYVELISAQL